MTTKEVLNTEEIGIEESKNSITTTTETILQSTEDQNTTNTTVQDTIRHQLTPIPKMKTFIEEKEEVEK